nr:MAG TPA: hypothetical protein [Caudoviricetes sp.]
MRRNRRGRTRRKNSRKAYGTKRKKPCGRNKKITERACREK